MPIPMPKPKPEDLIHRLRALLALSMGLVMLLSCSSPSAPAPQYFLLATPAEETDATSAPAIAIERISLPGYLSQQGIVLVNDERRVNVARFNFWAEALDEGIRRFMQRQLNPRAQDAQMRLSLDINFLHGTETGQVTLDADWRLSDSEGRNSEGQFRRELAQESPGYGPLVDAHALLLEQLASAIRQGASEL